MRKAIKIGNIASVIILLALATIAYGQIIEPTAPNNIVYHGNRTNAKPNGTTFNYTRGFIHVVSLNETQPTYKWVGYVGNITGRFGLVDANDQALYDWDLVSTTGEVYATKEGPGTDNPSESDGDQGGIPLWTNLTCAVSVMIKQEAMILNHTTNFGSNNNEDSINSTFETSNFVLDTFYVGESQITDSTTKNSTSSNCYGINLNVNNSDVAGGSGSKWQEVVLTDSTKEGESTVHEYDLIYASMVEDNVDGYNGEKYDFQMMLPQSGLEGGVSNIAYYFYVELV